MEVFAIFDVLDQYGRKVAEGHKASFCLEDNECVPGAEKKYICANYGDQGIAMGCADIYRSNIDCQWIDMTDVIPGVYTFKVKPHHFPVSQTKRDHENYFLLFSMQSNNVCHLPLLNSFK